MNDNPIILLVEDEDVAAIVAEEMLTSEYVIRHVASGEAALNCMHESLPDLILLDVQMPGMSGYEVCRQLRDDPLTREVPVIFLSGMASEADRLAGYEAGGDDYLTKSVAAAELRTKIKLQLASYAERRRIKNDYSGAFSTAMTAMTSSADIGAVLQFMRASYSCPDYIALCREVLNTLGSFGLEASVQIRGHQNLVSFDANGPCSPLAESVLTNMSRQGRIFEFGSRISCSYEHITIIIKSDSSIDPERHGRMKDNLAWLAEGANARVVALDDTVVIARQHALLTQLTASSHKALQSIEQRHRNQGIKNNLIFEALQKSFDRTMLTIGITQSQEEELANLIHGAAIQAQAIYDEGLEISEHMANILQQLDSTPV